MVKTLKMTAGIGLVFLFLSATYAQVSLPMEEADKLLVSRPNAIYPPLAQAARVEGTVVLEIIVSSSGKVTSYREISGSPLLMGAASEAVREFLYNPYLVDGKPTAFKTRTEFTFSLNARPSRPSPQQKRSQEYAELRSKCQNQLKRHQWKLAESTCTNLSQAKESDGFNWMYYNWIGMALLAQERTDEALTYFNKAVQLTPSATSTEIELAYANRSVGMAYHSLNDLEKAREFYLKTETNLQTAMQKIATPEIKETLNGVLKATQQLHELANRNAAPKDVRKAMEKQFDLALW